MSDTPEIETKKLWLYGFGVIIATTVLNIVIYSITEGLGYFEDVINPMIDGPITLVEVTIASVTFALPGLLLFYLLVRFTDRPVLFFQVIGIIALLASFFLPFSLEGTTTASIISLNLMHAVSAMGLLYILPRLLMRE